MNDTGLIVAVWMVTVFPGLLAVSARILVRYNGRMKPFIVATDVLVGLSFLASVVYCASMTALIFLALISTGKGRLTGFTDDRTNITLLKLGYATGNIYYFGLYAAKGAIIAILYGIVPETRRLHRKCLGLVTAVVASSGVFVLAFNLFACWPISNNWALSADNCYAYSQPRVLISSSALQLATDLTLVALPLPLLCTLRISPQQKIKLVFIFCLGFCCAFATTMRLILVYAPAFSRVHDGQSVIWSGIEMSTSICVACAPALRTCAARRKHQGRWLGRGVDNGTISNVAELEGSAYGLVPRNLDSASDK